jgi:T5SS/PEP-CTERM-associated repeat protein
LNPFFSFHVISSMMPFPASSQLLTRASTTIRAALLSFGLCAWFAGSTLADITTTGNVTPDPATSQSGTTLFVGNTADGTMTVSGGSDVRSNTSWVGYEANVTGTAAITGVGSTWKAGSLTIARLGSGELTISDGAQVSNSQGKIGLNEGSEGHVLVTGVGSTWTQTSTFRVGQSGDGHLVIAAGGQVFNQIGIIASNDRSTSSVEVTGNGSKWTSSSPLTVGSGGSGSLTVSDGGEVYSYDGTVGAASGASGIVTVSDHGSTWTNTGVLTVGLSTTGVLSVADGATISSSSGLIGGSPSVLSVGNVTISGSGSTWTISNSLYVGEEGKGTLTIGQGGHVDVGKETFVGYAYGADGQLGFTGGKISTRTLLAGASDLTGTGTVDTHGLVTDIDLQFDQGHGLEQQIVIDDTPQQNITVNLDVDGTAWLGAGYREQGSLAISQGVQVLSSRGYLGYQQSGSGSATVSGVNSAWMNSGELNVGYLGAGALEITAGGKVSSTSGTIAGNTTSSVGSVVVNGPLSTWINSGELRVGGSGAGTLRIEDGGNVSNTNGAINAGSNNSSRVVVSGGNSLWANAGNLDVSGFGDATLVIEQGGRVSNSAATIGRLNHSLGIVNVSGVGSTWSMTGRLSIGGDGATNVDGDTGALNIGPGGIVGVNGETVLFPKGTLKLEGGTLSTSSIRFQNAGGQFNWTSGTLHVGSYTGSLTNSAGVLAPGAVSFGSTTISGNYTQQPAGTLQIEIGGTTSGTQYDTVGVTGNTTTLGGLLQLSLLNGFIPTNANSFTVLSSLGIVNGSFSNVANNQRVLTTDGLGSFLVRYGASSTLNTRQVILTNFTIAGDFNVDGKVDAADYTVWRKSTGLNVTRFTSADADGSGLIDNADYTIWRSHFGLATGAGSASGAFAATTVPEPSSLALLSLLTCAMLVQRRRCC